METESTVHDTRLSAVNTGKVTCHDLSIVPTHPFQVAQIKRYKRVFMRFCHENPKAQKYFMGGFEKTVELFRYYYYYYQTPERSEGVG